MRYLTKQSQSLAAKSLPWASNGLEGLEKDLPEASKEPFCMCPLFPLTPSPLVAPASQNAKAISRLRSWTAQGGPRSEPAGRLGFHRTCPGREAGRQGARDRLRLGPTLQPPGQQRRACKSWRSQTPPRPILKRQACKRRLGVHDSFSSVLRRETCKNRFSLRSF